MNESDMWKPALTGGVMLGVLSALPLVNMVNCACCAWVIGGGMLAAHLYVRSSPNVVTLGSGLVLGLLTGAIGGIVDTLFSIPLQILMRNVGMGFAEQMRQVFSEVPNLSPEMRRVLESVVTAGGAPGIIFLILGGLINVVIFSAIAMLGGVLGVAIFEKRKIAPAAPPFQPPVTLPPPPAAEAPTDRHDDPEA
jgi:hypothetical protein